MAVQKFSRDDLKVGYVVELRNGEFRMVMPAGKCSGGTLILAGGGASEWDYLSRWDHNLNATSKRFECGFPGAIAVDYAKKHDIVAVYGYISGTEHYHLTGNLGPDHRPILWGRVEAKKMTVAEIEKELGYSIEIISEE